jgi:hypothetical protein
MPVAKTGVAEEIILSQFGVEVFAAGMRFARQKPAQSPLA